MPGRLNISHDRACGVAGILRLGANGALAMFLLAAVVGCRGTPANVAEKPVPASGDSKGETSTREADGQCDPKADEETRARELAAALAVLEAQTDPGWLVVTRVAEGAGGGWATGDFDVERNRLTIDTQSVTGFAADLSRVPVDWGRLVIVRLDGRGSELRKRDAAVYRFTLDSQGRWTVEE